MCFVAFAHTPLQQGKTLLLAMLPGWQRSGLMITRYVSKPMTAVGMRAYCFAPGLLCPIPLCSRPAMPHTTVLQDCYAPYHYAPGLLSPIPLCFRTAMPQYHYALDLLCPIPPCSRTAMPHTTMLQDCYAPYHYAPGLLYPHLCAIQSRVVQGIDGMGQCSTQ